MMDVPRSDHIEAAIAMLESFIKRMREGEPPEDVGPDIALVGRIMARRT